MQRESASDPCAIAFTQFEAKWAQDPFPDDATLAQLWPQARVLAFNGDDQVYVDASGQPRRFIGHQLSPQIPHGAVFLRQINRHWCFAVRLSQSLATGQAVGLRQGVDLWATHISSVLGYAQAVLHWQAQTQFCGRCAGRVCLRQGGVVGCCQGCGQLFWPRINPVIIVAVDDGQHLLLGRNAKWPKQRFSLIAGFMAPGETPEQAIVREVWEETGIDVCHSHYVAAQPWPFPDQLMLGFHATARPGQIPKIGDRELAEVSWFDYRQIQIALDAHQSPELMVQPVILPAPNSIAYALILRWYRETVRRMDPTDLSRSS